MRKLLRYIQTIVILNKQNITGASYLDIGKNLQVNSLLILWFERSIV